MLKGSEKQIKFANDILINIESSIELIKTIKNETLRMIKYNITNNEDEEEAERFINKHYPNALNILENEIVKGIEKIINIQESATLINKYSYMCNKTSIVNKTELLIKDVLSNNKTELKSSVYNETLNGYMSALKNAKLYGLKKMV